MIGNLPEKDMSFLEERIKRSQLNRPPPGSGGPAPAALAAPAAAMPPPPQPQAAPPPSIPEPRSGIPGNRNRNIPAPSSGLTGLKRYQAHQQQSQLQQLQQQQQQVPQPEFPSGVRRSPPSGTSGLSGRDRPVSGIFSLDLDKIENGGDGHRGSNGSGPKLVSHNLDEIFGEDSNVRLPPTYASGRSHLIGGGGGHSNVLHQFSPPTMLQQPQRNLIDSPEAYEALDVVLAQVGLPFLVFRLAF